jgi:stearoyl-CoA desaturase (delta-9 desaturase)
MTHNQTVRGLQIINHLLLVAGLVYMISAGAYYLLGISLITYVIIGMLGVNIGYHRLLSHRSFETYDIIKKICSIIGVLTTIGSPMAWVAIHRQHHRAAESEKDPHSPIQLGNFRAWMGLWNYLPLDVKLVRDFRKDKFQKFLHQYYLQIILAYCVVLAVINPWLVIFAYAIPACLCLHSTSSIIVIAHRHGYVNHTLKNDQARNSWIAHLMSLGEGWHNNHHARPYMWDNQERWWELDPPSWVIRLIKK